MNLNSEKLSWLDLALETGEVAQSSLSARWSFSNVPVRTRRRAMTSWVQPHLRLESLLARNSVADFSVSLKLRGVNGCWELTAHLCFPDDPIEVRQLGADLVDVINATGRELEAEVTRRQQLCRMMAKPHLWEAFGEANATMAN